MNKNLYRIVFNKARGLLMAAAEIAPAQGKRGSRATGSGATRRRSTQLQIARLKLVAFATQAALGVSIVVVPLAHAQIVASPAAPRNQQPTVLNAANGVPQVNIQTPSAAGVSRNTYIQFDVERRGAILNNSRTNTQTQLGGWIQGNPSLATGTARVILNEVNSSNPSLLRGYVEVGGDRAQVVIANPSGISCDGCGFINANRATLTTGTPVLNGGNLEGYRVQRGTVTIQGAGLDASQTDYTDIIARAVVVNAGVHASALKVTAGANQVSADHAQVTPAPGTGAAPAVAIDVAQLGGMYAGKITLVGNEAGVGVRNAGQIGASAGEVVVTASGRLENSGRITSTAATQLDAGGVSNSGTVYTQGNARVAARGNIDNSGVIAARGNTVVAATGADSRIDSTSASVLGAGIQTDGSVGASGDLDISATGSVRANGQNVASGSLTARGASLDLTGSQTSARNTNLFATSGALDASGSTLVAIQALTASAAQNLRTDDARVSANQISLTAGELSNRGGQITAASSLNVTGAQAIDNNRGVLAASGAVVIAGAAIDNTEGTIGSVDGSATLTAATGPVDNSSGRIEAGQNVQVAANGLTNTAGVVAGHDIRLDTRVRSFDNTRGSVAARRELDIQSGAFTNDAGLVQAGGALNIDTHGGTLTNSNSGAGNGILGQATVTLTTGGLDNQAGFVGATNTLTANSAAVRNTQGGVFTSEGNVILNAASLDNRGGQVQALGDVSIITGRGAVDNTASLIRSGQTLSIAAGAVTNADTQAANRGLEGQSVDITTGRLDNTGGAVRADVALTLTSGGSINNSQGLISSGDAATVTDANLAAKSLAITNTGGTIIAGRNVAVDSARLSGDGKVLSQGDLSVKLTSDYLHTGELQANGAASLETAGTLTNRSTLLAGTSLTLTAASVDNASGGEIRAGNVRLLSTSPNTLTNRGLIDGQETFLEAITLNNLGTGRIYGDHVVILATTLNNEPENGAAPVIAARNRLDIGAQTINNRERALIFSGGDMAIGGSLDASRFATGQAALVNNASATIEALGGLDLSARQINNTNERFSIQVAETSRAPVQEFQLAGSPNRYPGDKISTFFGEVTFLVTPDGTSDLWNRYDYTRVTTETQIRTSDPAQILAGGGMRITADALLNDKSRIIAGGALTANLGALTNTEVPGERIIADAGTATHFFRMRRKGRDDQGVSVADYVPAPTIQAITLGPSVVQQNTAPTGTGTQVAALSLGSVGQNAAGAGAATVNLGSARSVDPISQVAVNNGNAIRTGGVNTALPDNSLFRQNPNPAASYLIETDPRFANYRQWLSSDYLLQQLSFDPATTQKRLGDGFYEQRLVREQIAQLTGRRFLDNYANDEVQYRALIDSAVTYARQWNLRLGIALSAEQMAQLTSDIVWLVAKDVTLPNGQVTQVLAPQVYVRVREGDLDGSGALLASRTLDLNVTGDVINRGTLSGRSVLSLTAENVKNLGGRISGQDTFVRARTDLDNLGGLIEGGTSLTATAGRDLNVISSTADSSSAQGSRTNVSRVAALYVSEAGGKLLAQAGRDANLMAARITNTGTGGTTTIAAGNNLNLGTVTESSKQEITWNAANFRKDASRTEVGSTIQATGDVSLLAGSDLNARGANITSDQGALVAGAGRSINLTAGEATRSLDEAHQSSGRSGWFSRRSTTTRDTLSETTAQGTTLSGNTTTLQAGLAGAGDINVRGSNVVSTTGTTLTAPGNINIEAATNTLTESHLREERKSGLFSSGGLSLTYGTQTRSAQATDTSTTAAASTVGSIEGSVSLQAGNAYRQSGSHVLAPGLGADIDIRAQKVDILEAQNTSIGTQETKFNQSGLTLALSNPIYSAIETTRQMREASRQTQDGRLQALAGATTALAAANAYSAVNQSQLAAAQAQDLSGAANAAASAGGITLSITVGSTRSQSQTTQTSSTAAGSTVIAGRDVNITATGAGRDSDLTVQGSRMSAGRDATLIADDAINLLAARNTAEQQSTNTASSTNVGVAITLGADGLAFGVTANASRARGRADGADVSWTNTRVEAGDTLALQSGGDTTLRGAIAAGRQVTADIGGNLNIESLQDTSVFDSRQTSVGGSVTIGYGFAASANFASSSLSSNFASVIEQTGIRAGDAGFQVDVAGNTDLKGAVIASTDLAAQEGRNRLTTGTLTSSDIENRADYRGQSLAIGGGYQVGQPMVGLDQQGRAQTGAGQVPGTQLSTLGGFSAAPVIALNARDSAASTTRSGVSPAEVQIADEAKQQALTGRDAATTIATLNRDVTTGRDTSGALKPIFNEQEIQAGFAISGAFAREAGNFLALRAKDADLKETLARKAEAEAADPRFEGQRQALNDRAAALRAEARAINETWGPGTTNRQVLSALVAAASGNVSASTGAFIQAGVVNFVQQQGAAYIGKLVADGSLTEGSPEHASLHAIVACAGAAASSQSCGAGALGAATSSLLTNLFKQPEPNETSSQREAKGNIINALVAGTALALGGSTSTQIATVVTASDATVQNNYLTQRELVQKREALRTCKGAQCDEIVKDFEKRGLENKARAEDACIASKAQCQSKTRELDGVLAELRADVARLPSGRDKADANRNLAQTVSDYISSLEQLETYARKELGRPATFNELVKLEYLTPEQADFFADYKQRGFKYVLEQIAVGVAGGVVSRKGPSAPNTTAAAGDAAKVGVAPAGQVTGQIPGRVQSRVNVSNEGMAHVTSRHFNPSGNASQFTITEAELRSVLQSPTVVRAPVVELPSGTYLREVDLGRQVGLDATIGRAPTSTLTVITDRFGNLQTAFPGVLR